MCTMIVTKITTEQKIQKSTAMKTTTTIYVVPYALVLVIALP